MEYVSEGRIIRDIERALQEKLSSSDNTKTKEELYQETYEEVIQYYADYLDFDTICFYNKEKNIIEKVIITGYSGRINGSEMDCFLAIGTKVYLSLLKWKIEFLNKKDLEICKCTFTNILMDYLDKKDLGVSEYRTEALYRRRYVNDYCVEYSYDSENFLTQ